jgi:hypothetical protein
VGTWTMTDIGAGDEHISLRPIVQQQSHLLESGTTWVRCWGRSSANLSAELSGLGSAPSSESVTRDSRGSVSTAGWCAL